MRIMTASFGAALALLVSVGGAQASSDTAAGEKVFKRCKACHKLEEGKKGVGPSLFGIVGKPVASAEGYKYSKAMVEWGAGKVWDEEQLEAFLAAPKKVIKGTKMSFAGLKKEQQIDDLIDYLETIK